MQAAQVPGSVPGGIHGHLAGERHMDGTRLTFGVLPVRRAIRAQGLAVLQFLGVASDLHGQDGNAGQSLEQVFNPARIFADDVSTMTHAPAFAAAATLAWKVSMSGRPVCASPASTDPYPPVLALSS